MNSSNRILLLIGMLGIACSAQADPTGVAVTRTAPYRCVGTVSAQARLFAYFDNLNLKARFKLTLVENGLAGVHPTASYEVQSGKYIESLDLASYELVLKEHGFRSLKNTWKHPASITLIQESVSSGKIMSLTLFTQTGKLVLQCQ